MIVGYIDKEETMPKKPVVVEIDPNRISFESKTITKEDTDKVKAQLEFIKNWRGYDDVEYDIEDIPFT